MERNERRVPWASWPGSQAWPEPVSQASSESAPPASGEEAEAWARGSERQPAPPTEPPSHVGPVRLSTYRSAAEQVPRSETIAAESAVDRQAALRALRNLEATEARLERN